MCRRFALGAVEKDNVAGFGLLFAQLQAQADPRRPTGDLASLQRVPGGRRQRKFFPQRLGQLRTADANTLTLRSRRAGRDRPVASVGHSLLQQGRDHTQSCFTLHRGRAGGHARFQCLHPAAGEGTAPPANRVLRTPNAAAIRGLVQPGQRQQHGACPVRFSAIT